MDGGPGKAPFLGILALAVGLLATDKMCQNPEGLDSIALQ
jgi:hypothetical protein